MPITCNNSLLLSYLLVRSDHDVINQVSLTLMKRSLCSENWQEVLKQFYFDGDGILPFCCLGRYFSSRETNANIAAQLTKVHPLQYSASYIDYSTF